MSNPVELYDAAFALAMAPDDRFLDFARALRRLRDYSNDLFHKLVRELGISQRKAYYLVDVAARTDGLAIPDKRLVAIGWTRLAIVAPHLTRDNAEELIGLAEANTARDLETLMRGEDPGGNERCVQLYLGARQYALYRDAILAHGGKAVGRGLVGQERALMRIIATLAPPRRRKRR